jgi:hypothetical protein
MNDYQEMGFMLIGAIIDVLKKQGIKPSSIHEDGRVNSTKDEELLKSAIKAIVNSNDTVLKNIEYIETPSRSWMDCGLLFEKEIFPINIKSSQLNSADNLNCKAGMFWVVTGSSPHKISKTYIPFHKELGNNINLNSDKDYFFIIMNKDDTKDIFINSLRHIESLIPNGNNLPFQCNWGLNRRIYIRHPPEDMKYILDQYYKSLMLRSKAQSSYEEYVLKRYK